MRIRLLTQLSLDGAKDIGAVLEVPEAQGQALVDGGHAEVVKDAPAVPEAATLEDAPERATIPRGRKR